MAELKVRLVDVNEIMVAAWRTSFADYPEVEVIHGSMTDQRVSAWVSPTNSRGVMDGGLDLVIKNRLGAPIEQAVQKEIGEQPSGRLEVGRAVCVPTGAAVPNFLISTPTMSNRENVSNTFNSALSCAAALQAAAMQNRRQPGSITSLALPGLGTATGGVPTDLCADLMRVAYQLLQEEEFETFEAMRTALDARLEDLAPLMGIDPATAGPEDDDEDFDDEDYE